MYLNIGGDFSVRSESVVGVFDLDNTSCSKWTRKFLAEAQRAGAIVEATDRAAEILSGHQRIRRKPRHSDKI